MRGAGRPRVLQVGKFYHPEIGGMEEHLRDLANAINGRVDLRVLVANTRARTVVERVQGVEVVRAASLARLFATSLCPTLPRWISEFEPDIVHLHLPNPMAHFAFLASRARAKLVITWHSDVVRQERLLRLYSSLLDALLGRADRIIATSPNYIASSRWLSRFSGKCAVVPLGVDLTRYGADAPTLAKAQALRAEHGDRLVLFVGRLIYYKGVEHLLEAMRSVDARLLVVGEGPLEETLKARARALNLDGKVRFLGRVGAEGLAAHYHACDVLALPSIARSEAFGLVQVEAMACGKPVVCTELGTGTSWVNQHGKTGLVVAPGDSAALGHALAGLLADAPLRHRLGAEGRRRAGECFQVGALADRVLELYREVLA